MRDEEFAVFWGINIFGNLSEFVLSEFGNGSFLDFEMLLAKKCEEDTIIEADKNGNDFVYFKNYGVRNDDFEILKKIFINSLKTNLDLSASSQNGTADGICLIFKIKFVCKSYSGDFDVIVPSVVFSRKVYYFYSGHSDFKEPKKVGDILKIAYLNGKRVFSKKWNILDCFIKLDKKEIQKFIYYLITKGLTLRDISYILLGVGKEVKEKVIENLSDKAQDEIYYLMPDINPNELNKRKNEPFLIRFKKACAKADEILYEAIKDNKIKISSLREIEQLKEYFEIQKAQNFLAKKENNLNYILSEEKDRNKLRNIFSKIPFDTVVYSCVGEDIEVVNMVKNCLSSNNAKQLEGETAKLDTSFFYKRILNEKVKLIKTLKSSLRENEIDRLKKILRFIYANSKNGSALAKLLEYMPIEFFARALGGDFEKEFKNIYINLPKRKQIIFENTLKYEKYNERKDIKLESAKYIIKKIKELYKKNIISFYTEDIVKRDYFRALISL